MAGITKKSASAVLIPLLLLPNFLFLVPLSPASGQGATSQAPGQPLPPGTVSYRNTWNTTAPSCSATPTTQPLVPITSWNKTLKIPTELFNWSPDPNGRFITQSFVVSSNGTFSASDDAGNRFSIAPLAGLPPGVTSVYLIGNSTVAEQRFLVSAGPIALADVTVTYSVKAQFCQPSGVKFAIAGTAHWPSVSGILSIPFRTKPISIGISTPFKSWQGPVSTGAGGWVDRAWFGNASGVGLGFDWSDSKGLSPVFNAAASTLIYAVGGAFSIDPVTVGTSGSNWATASGFEGRVLSASSRFWVFYPTTSGAAESWTSSTTGLTWNSPSSLTSSGGGAGQAAYYVVGNTLYYLVIGSVYNPNTIYYRYGTLNSDGTITWSIAEGHFTDSCNSINRPSTTVDSSGNWWLSETCGQWFGSTFYYAVHLWKCTAPASCSWTFDSSGSTVWTQTDYLGKLTALTAGKISMVYSSVYTSMYGEVYTPSVGWSSVAATGGSIEYDIDQGSCVAIGDTTECAVPDWAGTPSYASYYLTMSYNGGYPAWSSPATLATACQASESISTDGSSGLALGYICSQSAASVVYLTSVNGGSSWGTTSAMTSAGSYAGFLTSSFAIAGNMYEMIWTTGGNSPYNVNFAGLPFALQDAATSTNSWSRPGLSPYESYFSHFSDYVSPGNGLVSVEAGTLDLPGRGMSFAPSLVYGEPYVFRSSGSSYLYDNYTGASLGYGWSLNLPWLGTNYLHLSDGQAYPYSWNGNTFQYNGVTNFVLTRNAGGTYTLNMSSGTLYRFDTSKRLISITDRTGNNAISLSYGANNYISQATDTIGRVITFSNTNNQLTSITSGTRTWTLSYAGSQLTSLTDPLSRVTTFQYAGTTGANAWLLSAVIWPTGGKVTYTYGSAPIGTEVTTYYATSRSVYYDTTHLRLTQSISYGVTNGQVNWSNSAISDGTTTQGYLYYNFQSSSNVMQVSAKDGTGTVQRITETDSDSAGRTIATKIFSPSGALLAQSTFSYDNWGNTVYSNDNVGHETWSSYANASPTNSFGSSGCTTSFFAQSISSNIHNLIVGSCDYQNGSGSPQQQTYYGYDSVGNLLKQKTLHSGAWLYTNRTYDVYGNVLSTTDANGHTTYYRYSSAYSSAYLTKQSILVGTQNVTTTYTYDSAKGFLLSNTDPNGQTTTYAYDALGRQTTVTYPAVGGVSAVKQWFYYDTNNTMKIVDENGHITKEAFDGLARLTSVQRYNGSSVYSTQSYAYNWCDAVASKTTAAGNTYTYSYDYQCRETKLTNPDTTYESTSYDDVNNLKTISDENGHQTVYTYDWNQRLTFVKQYNSSTNYFLTAYTYDKSGNLLSVADAHSPAQTTSYQYDDLNRLTTTTFPDTKTETRTYDSVGNLMTRTTANSSTISYTYDALNRLTKVTYQGSGGTVTYAYDQDSNRLSMVSLSATDYYSFDARDRLTNQTEYVGGTKYMTLYAYDGAGDITSLTYPDGYALAMVYDGVNRLKKVGSFATVGYTLDDKTSKITYGNGEVATYAYDNRDRPTQILDKYGSTKELSLNYTYDGTGNVLTLNTESYGYDWLNRLTSSSGPWGSYTYAYDQVGNRIRTVQGSTTTVYCYGSFSRLSGYYTASSCSSPSTSYAYDPNGNTITKTGGWTYSYDYENRLRKAVQSGTTVQTNSYDGDGNRVTQTAGSGSFVYSYQGLNILYEKNVTSGTTTITKRFYANGLQVAKMVGTATYYLHQDALGSTRLVATSTVTIKFNSNYVPYGSNYAVSGKEEFMYTGKPYDGPTGLYYEGARFYDSSTGRFITQDSITGTQDDPMSLNRYIYARDNPMKIVDLAGHEWWNPVAALTSAVSTVTSTFANVASAVTNAMSSLPPTFSNFVQSTTSFVQSTFTQLSNGISSSFSGLTDAVTRTASSVMTTVTSVASAVSNAYSSVQSGLSSLSLAGSNEPIVKTVSQYATNPYLKIAGGAGLISIGVLRMATPFLNSGGPNEPVPTTDLGVDSVPSPGGDFNVGPKQGFLSDLLQSEFEGAALVAAGFAMEWSGSHQLGCETSGRCTQ